MINWLKNQIKRYKPLHKIPMTRRTATEIQTIVLFILFVVCIVLVGVKELMG